MYCYLLVFFTLPTILFANALEELDTFIEQARKKWEVPGIAVTVVRDGKVVLKKGYGTTRLDGSEKVDAQTLFQLASVTKAFTACSLGTFVDQEKLAWDDSVIRYLPQFALHDPYPTRYATITDLLAHRTGLPAFAGDLLEKLGYPSEEVFKRIPFIEPACSFRERANYSNLCYFVAGEVLAKLSGTDFESALRKVLLDPLGMQRSGFGEVLDGSNVAASHAEIDGKLQVVPSDRTGGFPAAGALVSDAEEMGHWMQMLLNHGAFNSKQILKPETLEQMFADAMVGEVSFSEAAPIDAQSGFCFCLGWDAYHYRGQRVVEKGGGLDGIRTVVTLIPELNAGISILCNRNLTLLPEAIRAKFLEQQLGKGDGDVQATIRKQGEKILALLKKPEPPKKPLPLSQPLANYTGTYSSDIYGPFELTVDGDTLRVIAGPNRFQGTLTHFSNETFILTWPVVNAGNQLVTFTMGADGKGEAFDTEVFGVFGATKQPPKFK